MKRVPTFLLKAVVVLLACIVLMLCIFVLPTGITTDTTGMFRPLLLGMYIPAIPFFIGAFQVLKLLNLIDAQKAFSADSVQALRITQYSAFSISALYAIGLPYIYSVADRDDAPGLMVIGLVFTFAPFVIGAGASVLRTMFNTALKMKSENDLTV